MYQTSSLSSCSENVSPPHHSSAGNETLGGSWPQSIRRLAASDINVGVYQAVAKTTRLRLRSVKAYDGRHATKCQNRACNSADGVAKWADVLSKAGVFQKRAADTKFRPAIIAAFAWHGYFIGHGPGMCIRNV